MAATINKAHRAQPILQTRSLPASKACYQQEPDCLKCHGSVMTEVSPLSFPWKASCSKWGLRWQGGVRAESKATLLLLDLKTLFGLGRGHLLHPESCHTGLEGHTWCQNRVGAKFQQSHCPQSNAFRPWGLRALRSSSSWAGVPSISSCPSTRDEQMVVSEGHCSLPGVPTLSPSLLHFPLTSLYCHTANRGWIRGYCHFLVRYCKPLLLFFEVIRWGKTPQSC